MAALATEIGKSERQVRRTIRTVTLPIAPAETNWTDPVILVTDTTYFAAYGVMVFRCWRRRSNILWYFVGEETNAAYLRGLRELASRGYRVAAVVCDGKKWLCAAIAALGYPVQHCQFHLMRTVTRHLTRRPGLVPGQELRRLTLTLPHTTEDRFRAELQAWQQRWSTFLGEKTIDPLTGHWHYTHRRTRAAHFAIAYALPYLFIHERHPGLGIPTTTNTLDGTFSHLKQKIRVHRGLSIATEKKMIEALLRLPAKPKNQLKSDQ